MNLLLRMAAQKDYDAVCILLAQGNHFHAGALPQVFQIIEGPARSLEYFESILANENAAIFVAEQNGLLIGMIQCDVRTTPDLPHFVPRHFVYIYNLVVSERFRQKGVGMELVERVHQWTYEKGITEVELSVSEFNTLARMLYEKLGYKTTRRIMSKRL